eukprot:3712247-Prymnesium_polylepis.1
MKKSEGECTYENLQSHQMQRKRATRLARCGSAEAPPKSLARSAPDLERTSVISAAGVRSAAGMPHAASRMPDAQRSHHATRVSVCWAL